MSALPKLVAFSIALTAAPALVYRAATGGALDGEWCKEREKGCATRASDAPLLSPSLFHPPPPPQFKTPPPPSSPFPSPALCARLVGPPTHHARLTLAGLGAVVAVNLVRGRGDGGGGGGRGGRGNEPL